SQSEPEVAVRAGRDLDGVAARGADRELGKAGGEQPARLQGFDRGPSQPQPLRQSPPSRAPETGRQPSSRTVLLSHDNTLWAGRCMRPKKRLTTSFGCADCDQNAWRISPFSIRLLRCQAPGTE